MTDKELLEASERINTTHNALELAVEMLRDIYGGKSFDCFNYVGAVRQMESILAISKLDHARCHLTANTNKWTKKYQASIDVIEDSIEQIRHESAL